MHYQNVFLNIVYISVSLSIDYIFVC